SILLSPKGSSAPPVPSSWIGEESEAPRRSGASIYSHRWSSMISILIRKSRTLLDTISDFHGNPLASFRALDKGLEDRRREASAEVVDRVRAAYQAAKRDQNLAGEEYQANGEWTGIIE